MRHGTRADTEPLSQATSKERARWRQFISLGTVALTAVVAFSRPSAPDLDVAIGQTPIVRAVNARYATRPSGNSLRISTFNVAGGLKGNATIMRAIIGEKPDIACVQEAAKSTRQLATRRSDLGFAAADSPRLGNLILSRFRINHSEAVALPSAKDDPRGAVIAELDVDGSEVIVVDDHFSSDRDAVPKKISAHWRLLQAQALTHKLKHDYPGLPIIKCGDDNATPQSTAHQALSQVFIDTAQQLGMDRAVTYPITQHRIDYIWVDKHFWEVQAAHTFGRFASDHLGMTATISLIQPGALRPAA